MVMVGCMSGFDFFYNNVYFALYMYILMLYTCCCCCCLLLLLVGEVTNQVSKLMVPNPTKHIVADVQVSV